MISLFITTIFKENLSVFCAAPIFILIHHCHYCINHFLIKLYLYYNITYFIKYYLSRFTVSYVRETLKGHQEVIGIAQV